MTISLDSTGSVAQGSGPTNWSWTHTPVGTIDAVLVIIEGAWASDVISGVTYGGVGLTELPTVSPKVGSSGDQGTCYGYFLSGGLPTGAQTVSVTDSSNVAKVGASFGLIGSLGNGLEIVASISQDFGVGSNPSFTVTAPSGRDSFIAGCLSSGANTLSETVATGQTSVVSHDHGSLSGYISRKTSIHTGGDTTFGYTGSSFSHVMLAAAIAEVQSSFQPRNPAVSLKDWGIF